MICAKPKINGYGADGRRLYHKGGGSSSKSSSSTTNNITDKRIVNDGGVVIGEGARSTVNVTTLDGQVVGKALDSVNKAVSAVVAADATNGEGFGKLLDLAEKLFEQGSDIVQTSADAALSSVETVNTALNDAKGSIDQKTILILAAAGVAAAYAMKK